jgi:hypothetical protein
MIRLILQPQLTPSPVRSDIWRKGEAKSIYSGQSLMSDQEERQWEQLYQWYREFHARFAPYFIRAEAR